MHVIDTLEAGGAERVAVNLANLLPRSRYEAHLCTTRSEGVLAHLIAHDVGRLRLGRTRRYDIPALVRMAAYIRDRRIDILHAHGSALFLAALASALPPYPSVVWHLHRDKPAGWPYRLLARRVRGAITVTESLAAWSKSHLAIPAKRVWFIPNFSLAPEVAAEPLALPGRAGARVVCVANLRPEKDHLTLVRAMAIVVRELGGVHLLIVGPPSDPAYYARIHREIAERSLTDHITLLGQRQDVAAILHSCDVGILSSIKEGFPLSLIEYGLAGLPAVATDVGECAAVLQHGAVGIVVPPGAPDRLATALLSLLRERERRVDLGKAFRRRVETTYGPGCIMEQVCRVYEIART
jgi:glycosyltransferase involved in cell wall biosynthesis